MFIITIIYMFVKKRVIAAQQSKTSIPLMTVLNLISFMFPGLKIYIYIRTTIMCNRNPNFRTHRSVSGKI